MSPEQIAQKKDQELKRVEEVRKNTPKELDCILPNFGYEDGQFYELTKRRALKKRFATVFDCIPTSKRLLDKYLSINPLKINFAWGEDIHNVFENFRPESCMRHEHCHGLRLVYEENPDKVCVAYLEKQSHPALTSDWSALVWTIDDVNYIDRSYSNGYIAMGMLGHIHAAIEDQIPNNYETKLIWHGCSEASMPYEEEVEVELSWRPGRLLPYTDSFHYVSCVSEDTITLTTKHQDDVLQILDSTSGKTADGGREEKQCKGCNCNTRDWQTADSGAYCKPCISKMNVCYLCQKVSNDPFQEYELCDQFFQENTQKLCESCAKTIITTKCGRRALESLAHKTVDGEYIFDTTGYMHVDFGQLSGLMAPRSELVEVRGRLFHQSEIIEDLQPVPIAENVIVGGLKHGTIHRPGEHYTGYRWTYLNDSRQRTYEVFIHRSLTKAEALPLLDLSAVPATSYSF